MSHLRDPARLPSASPRPSRSSSTLLGASSPPPHPRQGGAAAASAGPSTRATLRRRSSASSASKENEPIVKADSTSVKGMGLGSKPKMNGNGRATSPDGLGLGQVWRDGSLEPEDSAAAAAAASSSSAASEMRKRYVTRRTKSPSPAQITSPASPRSPSKQASGAGAHPYNGLPTLPPISDDPDCAITDSPTSEHGFKFRPPPPAPSAATGTGDRPVTRPRRSSSIKRKLSPGVRPVKAVDWEIPRKTLHSSIGFVALFLYSFNPPSISPLAILLSISLAVIIVADYLRFSFPAFRDLWEQYLGFLMRESERTKINGVVWYLVGVIFVLLVYPREVMMVSILTLSWSDTTASTIGRLWGRYTPPLPPHFPFIPAIKFAPRKSLAGFLAAVVTGVGISTCFWWSGTNEGWAVLSRGWPGKVVTAGMVGVGGAVVEALDLGLDDNLTLPILTGAFIWLWLSVTQVILA